MQHQSANSSNAKYSKETLGDFISNDLTQMVHFLTQIPECDSHSPAISDLFHLTLVFVVQQLFFYQELLMFLSQFPLTFQQTQKWVSCFITQLMTILVLIDMVFFINPWENIFKLRASAAATEFSEWVQVRIEVRIELVNISQTSLSSTVFSSLYCCDSSQKSPFVSTNRINL